MRLSITGLAPVSLLAIITRAFWFFRGLRVRAGDAPYDYSTSDAAQYLIAARNLRFHHVYSFVPDLTPTYFRAPGYSMMIAALWGSESNYPIKTILIAQAILGVLTTVLVYFIALRFGKRIALIAGIGMALAPMSGLFVGEISTEILYTFLITFAVFAWGHDKPIWSGLIFGLSWMVRPTTMAFLVCAILITLLLRSQRRKVALISLIALLTVSPWIVRNWIVFGKPVPVAVAGGRVNLYFGTLDIHYGENVWKQTLKPENAPAYGWDDPRSEDIYFQRAIERIRDNPFHWIVVRVKQYPRLLIDLGAYIYPQSRAGIAIFKSLFLIGNLTLLLLAFWGGYLARARLELILFPVFILLFHIPMWVEPRYSLPMVPMVIICAAVATCHIFARRTDRVGTNTSLSSTVS